MVPVLAGPAQRSATGPDGAAEASRIASALLTWTSRDPGAGEPDPRRAGRPGRGRCSCPVRRACAHAEVVTDRAPGCWWSSRRRSCSTAWPSCSTGYCRRTAGSRLPRWRRCCPASSSSPPTWPSCRSARRIPSSCPACPAAAQLTLSVGTTAGVAALVSHGAAAGAAAAAAAAARAAVPGRRGQRAGGLAAVGIAALVAQDAATVVVIRLANGHGGSGAIVLYNYGWQAFVVPVRGARHPHRHQRLPGAVHHDRAAVRRDRPRPRREPCCWCPGSARPCWPAQPCPPPGMFIAHQPAQAPPAGRHASQRSLPASSVTGWWRACPGCCWRTGGTGSPRRRWRAAGCWSLPPT